MAFGIGTNTAKPEHQMMTRTSREVAVKCWFTATGRAMPLMMKVQTKEEELVEVNGIRVLTAEKQFFAGILNWKYRCQAVVNQHQQKFTLLFCPEECSWKLLE